MGVMAIYPGKNLSKLGMAKYIHSYKLRGLDITHSNKQEYIYIWPAEDGNILVSGIKEYMNYYNNQRTHQSLDRKTPYDWYEFAA